MDDQCLLPNTALALKFDGFNFDGLAGKLQKRQNFPCQISCYTVVHVAKSATAM